MRTSCHGDQADLNRLWPDNTAIAAACPWAIESSMVSGPVAEPATKTPGRGGLPMAP